MFSVMVNGQPQAAHHFPSGLRMGSPLFAAALCTPH